MTQAELLTEFRELPVDEQFDVIQAAVQIVQQRLQPSPEAINETGPLPMGEAAELLLNDYLNDKELTIFAALDGEPFYAQG